MTHHTLQPNQLKEVILVEGSAPFVEAFITNFKETLNPTKGWKLNFKKFVKVASAEVIIGKSSYHITDTDFLVDIIKSVSAIFADKNIILTGTKTVIRYKHYTITFTPDVANAIRQQAEVTYIVTGKLAKKLSPKNIARAENLVEYFHDTCFTYYEHKSLTANRYYFASVQQPLPIKEIVQLYADVHFILEQFNQVTELNCTLRATGISQN